MEHLRLSLTPDLQRYVDGRVSAEGYADPAEFVRDLVQRDQAAYEADVVRVQALIQEGRDSGIIEIEPEVILDEIIARLQRQHG